MTYFWPERPAVAEQARRVNLRRTLIALGVVVVIMPTLDLLADSDRHTSWLGYARGVFIDLLVFGAVAWLMSRMSRNSPTAFGARIETGFPPEQRKRIRQAHRTATPSPDPLLAAIEFESASRIVREGRGLAIAFGVLVPLTIAMLTLNDSRLETIESIVLLAALVAVGLARGRELYYVRRYLATVGHPPGYDAVSA